MLLFQVEVFWKDDSQPSRSDHCDTVDTPAPPPLPIEVINITETDTRILLTDGSTREVRVFVRLVSELRPAYRSKYGMKHFMYAFIARC